LNPVRFDGGDSPSVAGIERRSQLFLTDGEVPDLSDNFVLPGRAGARRSRGKLIAVKPPTPVVLKPRTDYDREPER
jgi:hypothetical protein